MGHSGSVHRPRPRHSGGGALYGEPVGTAAAANAANNREQYTPAQLQALYLSRGRPDMAFLTNQSSVAKEIPEMQQTCTVKNHVNLKKGSLKLTPVSDDSPDRLSLEFQFDATKPCTVKVYLIAVETIDDETGCSSYALAHPEQEVICCDFGEGLGQKFSLNELKDAAVEPFIDLSKFPSSELEYDPSAGSLRFPLIVVLKVRGNGKAAATPQSQSNFATFFKKPTGEWAIKSLKQKIQVDGMTYELQEIYGIDGSVASAQPKSDGGSGSTTDGSGATSGPGGAKDEIEIPDGAECIICMSETRNTTVLPCRHMCLCGECAEMLRKNSSTCPICRTRVEALLQIRVETKGDKDDDDDSDNENMEK